LPLAHAASCPQPGRILSIDAVEAAVREAP
jgi:hypothetical protein